MKNIERHKNTLVVIALDRSDPWLRIFLEGQLPTWIRECQDLGIRVMTCESLPTRRPRYWDEKIWVWSHDPVWGLIFRLTLWLIAPLGPSGYRGWEEKKSNSLGVILEKSVSSRTFYHRRNKALFEWIAENPEYEWIYRVTSSSFVHPKRFIRFIEHLPKNSEIICGQSEVDEWGRKFLSGSGLLFSRAAAVRLLGNMDSLKRDLAEDVGLGLLADDLGIRKQEIQRVDIAKPVDAVQSARDNPSSFHFRCKSSLRPEGDIQTMEVLSIMFGFRNTGKQYGGSKEAFKK